jgi:hypothetical protein
LAIGHFINLLLHQTGMAIFKKVKETHVW